jgi:hypothetical protein
VKVFAGGAIVCGFGLKGGREKMKQKKIQDLREEKEDKRRRRGVKKGWKV